MVLSIADMTSILFILPTRTSVIMYSITFESLLAVSCSSSPTLALSHLIFLGAGRLLIFFISLEMDSSGLANIEVYYNGIMATCVDWVP